MQLASEVLQSNPRLSRHLEREATGWFARGGEPAKALDSRARVAETYIIAATSGWLPIRRIRWLRRSISRRRS